MNRGGTDMKGRKNDGRDCKYHTKDGEDIESAEVIDEVVGVLQEDN